MLQGYTGHAPKALLDKFSGAQAQRIEWQVVNPQGDSVAVAARLLQE